MSKVIKFNAGKVNYDEDTKKCTPLPVSGTIQISPSIDDPEFLSFTWTPKLDSTSNVVGTVEKDELLLIPGDVSFKQIKSCTTGRVFKLTFLSSGASHLYWLQDVADLDHLDQLSEKDQKIIRDIQEAITLKEEDEDEEEVDDVTESSGDKPSDTADDFSTESTTSLQPQREHQRETQRQNQSLPPQDGIHQTNVAPISDLSFVLDETIIETHLDSLSHDEIKRLYKDHLPKSMENASKYEILQVIKSPYFKQNLKSLNESLRQCNGAGYLLSQSLKFDYKGEGIEAFLQGIRQLKKKQ